MDQLVRITRTLKDKGMMLRESEVNALIEPTTPYYQSLYYYPDDALEHFSKKKSIKGYRGKVYTPYIVFDIDSKDLDISKQNTIILIDWLKEQGLYDEYAAKIAFSGSKGFHLTLKTAYKFTPKELKSLCMYISSQVPFVEEAGFKRVDPSIYNTNRQFRIVNTINNKSKLYKIEMVESELRGCTMDTIKHAAAKPQTTYPFEKTIDDKPIRAVLLNLKESKDDIKPQTGVIKTFMGADIKRKHCVQIIQDGDMADGESNSGLIRLASHYRRSGYTQEQTREKLVEAAAARKLKYPSTNDIDDEKIDQEILYPVYSTEGYIFTCDDWFLKLKCQGACEKNLKQATTSTKQGFSASQASNATTDMGKVKRGFKASPKGSFSSSMKPQTKEDMMKLSGFKTISESAESFKTFAEDWKKHRVMTGIKELDDVVRMLPTGLVIINAKPGVGKTSIALNIMENSAASGKNVLFYSIDMVEDEFFTKSKSKALKISPDDVLDLYFREDDEANKLKDRGTAATAKMLENVYVNYDSGITPEKIDRDLTAFKEAGITIHLVIIDYLQKMDGCGDFTSPRIGTTLMGLKSLQPKHKVCIIGLSQMPRGKGGDEEAAVLTAAAAKGGGVYEENASVIINLWRPMKFAGRDEHGKSLDTALGYMVAKNRMGECKQGVMHFEGAISGVRSMTDDELEDFVINVEARKLREQSEIKRGF